MRRTRFEYLIGLIFAGFVSVFFYQTLLFGKLPVPSDALVGLYHPWRDKYIDEFPRGMPFKNFLITDPIRQQIPWRKIAIDQWKQGIVPFWNPYVFSGATLAGNIQAGVFYPLNIIFFVLPFPVAWSLLIFIQPLLGGLFLYVFLRGRMLDPRAALLGAVAWSFSGFSVAWLTWGTIVQSALWIPLILNSVDRILSGATTRWAILVIALTMMWLAGHAQIALYGSMLAIAYGLWRGLVLRHVVSETLWKVLFAVVVFLLFTSIQWLPLLNSLLASSRVTGDVWRVPGFFLPWQHLIQFLVPDFFGNPATLNYWGVWNWAELVGYIGMAPIILGVIALFSVWGETKFWFWAIIVGLVFALPTPLARLPYMAHMPLFSSLQPTRLIVIVDLALAVLAAYGAQSILHKPRGVYRTLAGVASALTLLWVFILLGRGQAGSAEVAEHFSVAKRNVYLPTLLFFISSVLIITARLRVKTRFVILGALISLSMFDLLRFGWKFTPFTDRKYFFPETQIIAFLKNQPKPFRVMSLDDKILPPNTSAYFGIETIEGYDPVYSADYEKYFAALSRGSADISAPYGFNRILTTKNIDSPFLPYLNVRYVLALADVERPFLKKVMQEGETRLYEYTVSLPRIYLSDNAMRVTNETQLLAALLTKPRVSTAVYTNPSWFLLSFPMMSGEGVTMQSYEPSRIVFQTTANSPRLAVVLNQYDPNWTVQIDNGNRVAVSRVNYSFTGILVPAGTHTVTMTYRFAFFDASSNRGIF